MTLVAVTVAVLLLGIPLAVFGGLMIWDGERSTLELRTSNLARSVERRIATGEELDDAMLAPWIGGEDNREARIIVLDDRGRRFVGGSVLEGEQVVRAFQTTPSGATVRMEVPAAVVQWRVARVVALVVVAAML